VTLYVPRVWVATPTKLPSPAVSEELENRLTDRD